LMSAARALRCRPSSRYWASPSMSSTCHSRHYGCMPGQRIAQGVAVASSTPASKGRRRPRAMACPPGSVDRLGLRCLGLSKAGKPSSLPLC
jgi:hypothetical protein